MKKYLLTGPAKDDLREIIAYLRDRSPQAAKRVRTKLGEAMRQLAEMPSVGHLREDLADEPLRFWSVYSYLIVYRPDTEPLQIIRVLHGARDIKTILENL